jgi:hypothetical protein
VKSRPSLFVAPSLLLSLAACSSSSSPPVDLGAPDDGGGSLDASGGPTPTDAPNDSIRPADGVQGGQDAAAAGLPAGNAGVDAFCVRICNHEQTCATALDASPSALSGCASSCQTDNEAAGANPPTTLLRADYIAALGACITTSSCDVALATIEADCAKSVATGIGDAGPITPTQAVSTLCHDIETSQCTAGDSGTQDCANTFVFYSDVTLNAAISCFSSTSCSSVVPCYSAAFTQP